MLRYLAIALPLLALLSACEPVPLDEPMIASEPSCEELWNSGYDTAEEMMLAGREECIDFLEQFSPAGALSDVPDPSLIN